MAIAARMGSERRLRRWLLLLFAGLALPTVFLASQTWTRLQYEAFYTYAQQAEALTGAIDAGLGQAARELDALGVDDFVYGRTAGGADTDSVIVRSALATVPVTGPLPGVLGYFEIGADGEFGSPLIPEPGTQATSTMDDDELAARRRIADELRAILAENRLLAASGKYSPGSADGPEDVAEMAELGENEATRQPAPDRELARYEALASSAGSTAATSSAPQLQDTALEQLMRASEPGAVPEADVEATEAAPARSRNSAGRLADLRLDTDLQQKSASDERATRAPAAIRSPPAAAEERAQPSRDAADAPRLGGFETDIEAFRFGLLESGHAVLFRNAMRDGSRYIQGALVARDPLLDETIVGSFAASSLSGMSDLVIAFGDDILRILRGSEQSAYAAGADALAGSLLHRARLSPPFENLELVLSVRRLPAGPAAGVLAWTLVLIAVVLVGGFAGLYRLGVGQIRLARQQQDFVSAISHELKTPLTSIRMYGEMLRDGWTDEARRDQYYAYIHDEAERLSKLIDNVLQLARISRQEALLELQTIEVAALRDLLTSKVGDSVSRAGFELRVSVEPSIEAATLRVDPDSFLQIAINLVDNAMKFSASSDRRLVDCAFRRARDDAIRFAVRDYGPGVPKTQLRRIFELFYRPQSELTRETVGTGIGLSIVKTLAEGMGARVDVVNTDPGAEFRVEFPRRGPSGPPRDRDESGDT